MSIDWSGNRLLAAVEPRVRTDVAPRIEALALERDAILLRTGEEIRQVVFPVQGMVGLISASPAGDTVQTGMVGRDGAVGVFEACGSRRSTAFAEVQVPGAALVMPVADYRRLFTASPGLQAAVHKFVEVLLAEARQFVACNALHAVEARFCRSVLEALDHIGEGDVVPLKQETLSEMLGVQRTTVTAVVSQLQAAGVLRTWRGGFDVLDRAALERSACSCREHLLAAHADIYGSDEEVCSS
ncbi:Crp/Fnr family transcriptional regulator [Phenylobacterium sp.]|jgi:CRP-like cAMP-binding protein|uniref:Crp/Fnr family transcriptional regulator n=1 Tax=Phenylobacterium sp. TaxID=1871053 RepID=UPI002F92DCF7